jgi:hypothetical protein
MGSPVGGLAMQRWWRRACVALLEATLGGCATVTTPATWQPGDLQPLIVGWQQYFQILWGVTRQGEDALVDGYITNTWGYPTQEVRVLVKGYDASGRQVGELITVPAGAETFDVSIFSWKWRRRPS